LIADPRWPDSLSFPGASEPRWPDSYLFVGDPAPDFSKEETGQSEKQGQKQKYASLFDLLDLLGTSGFHRV
jgi:hypothetical protein